MLMNSSLSQLAKFLKFCSFVTAYQFSLVRNCSNSTESTKQKYTDEQYDEKVKCSILNASLPHVPDLGWSRDALAKGAESLGYPGIAHGLFPQGPFELIQHFQKDSNHKLANKMKKSTEEASDMVPKKFLQDAVETRLRMNVPYLSRWPQAIALMASPPNVPQSLAALLTLIDDICYYAGDRSVDFMWYARRVALAGVYKGTELYMIQDHSEDHKLTWEFLDKRLEELFELQMTLGTSDALNKQARDTVFSAFTIARNILGINLNR